MEIDCVFLIRNYRVDIVTKAETIRETRVFSGKKRYRIHDGAKAG